MTIFYLDYVNGNDANDGSSWVNAWQTITTGATAARIAAGDIIRIAKSPDPTSLGMTAAWTDLSRAVTLNSALTANIELCETDWVASANVTCTTSTTRKEGAKSASFAIAALFATGKVAYKALAGATDYSGYQQISFWIKTSAAIAADTLKLSLCSDAIGDVIVDDFVIPALPGTGNRWTVFTINKGAALGASIQSVALYALLDPATPTILIDNIIACKDASSADSLSLASLISKNSLAQGGTEGWYGIKSINGTAIELDADTNSGAGAGRGYSGTTETVTTYKRETIKTALAATATAAVQAPTKNGSLGNNIEYQGGWDTGTTTQNGETFFDGSNGNGYGLSSTSRTYNTLNYLNTVRYNAGINFSGGNNNTITISNLNNNIYGLYLFSFASNNIITISNANNNSSYGIYNNIGNNYNTFTIVNMNSNGAGIYLTGNVGNSTTGNVMNITNMNNNSTDGINCVTYSHRNIFTATNIKNNSTCGISLYNTNNNIITVTNISSNGRGIEFTNSNDNIITATNIDNNANYGLYFVGSSNNTIRSTSTSGNITAGIYNELGTNYLNKTSISEAIKVEIPVWTRGANMRIFSQHHDNITDNHWIFTYGGTINSQTAVRHTASGIAWLFNPTSGNRLAAYPLDLNIAKIAVSANNLVTVKAWFQRDNTGLTMSLACKGGQITGVPSDVTVSMTAIAGAWEELQIQFTPTEVGVVEIQAWAYGGTTYSGYVDDMTILQA